MSLPPPRRRRRRALPDFIRCRRSLEFLLRSVACLLLPMPWAAAADAPAESGIPISLEELSGRFQNAGAPVARKAKDLLALVDSEASAQRISEPLAEGLRWTLRHFFPTDGGDVLGLLASTRMPLEDAALMEAARSLDDAERAAQARRAALKAQAIREAAQRSGELLRHGRSVTEIDAFLRGMEHFQSLTEQHAYDSAPGAPASDFLACIALMRSLRGVIALAPADDFSTVDTAVGQFKQDAFSDLEFASLADYSTRASALLAFFQQAADAVRDDFGSALIAGKSGEPIELLSGKLVDATRRLSEVSTILVPEFANFGHRECEATSRSFTALDDIAPLIASRQWNKAGAEIASAREFIPQMAPRQAAALEALLTKLERQIADAAESAPRESEEQWRAKLGAVKQPSDLAAIATELSDRPRNSPGFEDSWGTRGLAKQLSALAAAWSSEDLNLVAEGDLQGGAGEDAGLAALRERIMREMVIRSIDAPELDLAPFADRSLGAAIEAFLSKLAAEGKWRRMLEVFKTESIFKRIHGLTPRAPREAAAVRSCLAGHSLEAAGLWTEAAAAYKSVLASVIDNGPVADAADRLKALAKEHPGSLKTEWLRSRLNSAE